ncbi:MAG: ATP-binding protein [Muribaculaceae bacterium]|nr:ATP-binding protein [Muribaculaceae bacterium]
MTIPKYPVGIQTFSEIIEGGYTYVDKTEYVARLTLQGKYYFLSRPRRFGKSLLLSTLRAYFEGRHELFEGLVLDSMNVNWTPRPVIHIDLNTSNYTLEDGLDKRLDSILSFYEKQYDISEPYPFLSVRFEQLIQRIYERTGRQVAILVDEYDKPLLAIEDNPKLFIKNQATLKGFFGVLKSMDMYICFAMLTGVARFNKVSVFSDLNNLDDISMSNDFAEVCGWTEKELTDNFKQGIQLLAEENGMSYENALLTMRKYYDGYQFTPKGSRLYNPFSVLSTLKRRELDFYWFQTGTPTFLAKRVRDSRIDLPSLNSQWVNRSDLVSVGFDSSNPVPLLFQTGYLTIKSTEGRLIELHFPNYEVETGFAQELLPFYLSSADKADTPFSIVQFHRDLYTGDISAFMKRLQTMIKDIPYEQHSEKLYQNLIYLIFTLAGSEAQMERHTNNGRTDLEIITSAYIYIFEFKYNKSAEEAIAQIHSRDYAGRYALNKRQLYLIGANFSDSARGLDSWIIEKL